MMVADLFNARPAVKICGLRTPEQVRWVRESGAVLAGLVFAASRRRIDVDEGRVLAAAARAAGDTPPVGVVGVFAGQDEREVVDIAAACALDLVQLSGGEHPEVTRALVACGLRVIKAVHVAEETAVEEMLEAMAEQARAGATAILLDTASRPGETRGGGTGRTFDWQIARQVVQRSPLPIILAGGLTPHNVALAMQTVQPHGVDVSSGVETDGIKDRAKIAAFVDAALRVLSAES
jgi:phosphoribosylanthranilate isomerase